VRLSVFSFGINPLQLPELATRAEVLGFDTFWMADHLVTPIYYASRNPTHPTGSRGYEDDTFLSDVWVLIGHLSALTHRLRFGTAVYVLPLRNVFTAAQAIATSQVMSQGRVSLGIGVGWLAEEYRVVGQTFAQRGERLDEALDILPQLWSGAETEFHGRWFDFPPVRLPVASAVQVPMVFGGTAPKALERTARRGDGWFSPLLPLEAALRQRETIERLRHRLGRDGHDFEYYMRLEGPMSQDNLERHAAAGVEHLVISPWTAGRLSADVPIGKRLANLELAADIAASAGFLNSR
jgi:probable F420-dependent oxidoreductase